MSRLPVSVAELGDILLTHPSAPWRHVRRLVEMAAAGSSNVLLLGAPGTGKESVARAIHALSARKHGPFLTLPRRAAFERALWGAGKQLGLLEEARNGTLFLDGTGWMTVDVQERLAQYPEVRLILAAEGPFSAILRDQQFGSNVFHKLRMFPITLPALSECPAVLPDLVRELVIVHARKARKKVDHIPPKTMQAIAGWRWAGNLPELDGFIQRAVGMTKGRALEAPLREMTAVAGAEPVPATLEAVEREHILRMLRECSGVVTTAAARLGLPRTTLNARMKKLAILRSDY